ncbi:hypothetical protein So717_05910 [Roseobacter cerasinus]|uniref:Uncharacterized protein n=1 Tax=Roseobacter cerasinus TaxID=2602289 RepID=A0A640VK58_9RHOB|nr:hypothetical protein [Roseobacter cerasinus]GFE48838.1 hypothetical protein So717_05910 [Roseobacter cerasinus]
MTEYDWIEELSDKLETVEGPPLEIWRDTLNIGMTAVGSRISAQTKVEDDNLLKSEFAEFMVTLANDLGVGIPAVLASEAEEMLADLVRFSKKTRQQELRSKLRAKAKGDPNDRTLSKEVIASINPLIAELRERVAALNLSERHSARLGQKISEFEQELRKQHITLGRLLPAIAIIGAVITSGVAVLADGPDALETLGKITALIGYDGLEDEDQKLLETEAKPLALPAPPIEE